MPGSGLKVFTMVDKEADLDLFLDGDDDDISTDLDMYSDMESVFEAMKHVPLPEIDYPVQAGIITPRSRTFVEPLSGTSFTTEPDPVVRQGIVKRKVVTEEAVQPKKRGGTSRAPKRLKIELQTNGMSSKTGPIQAAKGEIVVGKVTAAAAKVAAEVSPNVVTSGTVAEVGPRPDFSLWTVEDDLLLKNAMEAGAAIEALAKGAMRFSRRFTVKEFRERWRALLYDPEIATEAALRMAEAEYFCNYSAPKSPVEQKTPRELARKRKANSLRTLWYKQSKKAALDNVALDSANDVIGSSTGGACGASNGTAICFDLGSRNRSQPESVTRDSEGPGSVPSKEGHSSELEDGGFSQMYSLLAAGGVKAVIAAIPAGISVSASEQEVRGSLVEVPSNGENDLRSLAKSGCSKQFTEVLQSENGQLSDSKPGINGPEEAAGMLVNGGAVIAVETSAAKRGQFCLSVGEGSFTVAADNRVDATLPPSKNCSELPKKEVERDVFPTQGNFNLHCGQEVAPVQQVYEVHPTVNGDMEGHAPSLSPASPHMSEGQEYVSGVRLQTDNRLIAEGNKIERMVVGGVSEATLLGAGLSEVEGERPNATSLASSLDHREVTSAETKAWYALPPADKADHSNLGLYESSRLLQDCPNATIDANMTEAMEEAETIEALYRVCCDEVEHDAAGQAEEEITDADDCCCTGVNEGCDCYSPSYLTLECTGDLDCPYLTDCCNPQQLELGLCTLNTEDSEVPSLEDSLLGSPSRSSSPSDQGVNGSYGCSPYDDAGGDEYYYPDEDANANVDADCEYINHLPPRQGVFSTWIDPQIITGLCGTSTDPAMLGSSVDRNAGRASVTPGNQVDGERGTLLTVEDESIGLKCAAPVANIGICIISTSASELGGSYPSTPGQALHQQEVPQEVTGGRLQAANNFGAHEWQMSTSLPLAGDVEINPSANRESPTAVPPETQMINGEAPASVQDSSEEEEESDEELARFSDIETMIMDLDLDVADDDFSARAESREKYMRHRRSIVRFELAATASIHRALNLRGALAILYGFHTKFFITKSEVLLGRATSDNIVDVDLGKEGRANKVSRQQANIKLKDDGVFYLRNLGRRSLTVNNKPVEKGERAILGSNCYIEVGGMRFIFEINGKLVKKHISRRPQR